MNVFVHVYRLLSKRKSIATAGGCWYVYDVSRSGELCIDCLPFVKMSFCDRFGTTPHDSQESATE